MMTTTDYTHPTTRAVDDRAFQARKHETITRRTNKGATTQRVTRRGYSQHPGDFTRSDGDTLPVLAEVLGIHRGVYGWSGIDLVRLADAAYSSEGLEPLLGTDAMAFAQVIHAGEGAQASPGVVAHHDDMLGFFHPRLNGAIRTPGARKSSVKRHPVRLRLPAVRTRKRDPRTITTVGNRVTVTYLTAPSDDPDRIFHGHRAFTRGTTTRTRTRRTAQVDAAHKVDTMSEALDALAHVNRGERVVMRVDGMTIRASRSKSDRWSFRYRTASGLSVSVEGARTVDAVRRRVMAQQ